MISKIALAFLIVQSVFLTDAYYGRGGGGQRFGPPSGHRHGHGGPGPEGRFGGGRPCSNSSSETTEELNKRIVTSFYQEAFGDLNIDAAADKYIQDPYIQHNPQVPDGKEGFKTFAKAFLANATPNQVNFWRVAADGDLVWLHIGNVSNSSANAVVDIFRVENGKIVEHWDVMQTANAPFANSHPMN